MTEGKVNRVFELLDDPENEELRAGVNMIFDIENFRENQQRRKPRKDNSEKNLGFFQWMSSVFCCRFKVNQLIEDDVNDDAGDTACEEGQKILVCYESNGQVTAKVTESNVSANSMYLELTSQQKNVLRQVWQARQQQGKQQHVSA